MDDRRIASPIIRCLIHYIPLILMLSVNVTEGSSCLDIVIAVDTTSSQTASSFDEVKREVKGIVSGFTVEQSKTRLALISISQNARVIVNFNGVNSLSDFNTAVDSLTFSTEIADLSDGIKVAKDSVLNTARATMVSKVLILVMDRRSGSATISGTAVLSQMKSEAAAVKSLGAVIHAIGIGGLWNGQELSALYGTDYLMFKSKDKALKSVKSYNPICEINCPNKGASTQRSELCYDSTKHTIKSTVVVAVNSAGLRVCRKEIFREFDSCSGNQRCIGNERTVSSCGSDGKETIEHKLKIFDSKIQSCVTVDSVKKVNCGDADKCVEQVADVIFILDKSGSVGPNFPKMKKATKLLIKSMNIGPDAVRVGVMTFEDNAYLTVPLGSSTTKADLLVAVDNLADDIDISAATYTNLALKKAREAFVDTGRVDVARFVFLVTDGESSDAPQTLIETSLIKNAGVTLYAIGVDIISESELRTMTAPDSDTNLVSVKNFDQLTSWSQDFAKKMCVQLSAPNTKLCDNKVVFQSISECTIGKQLLTKTEYNYNAAGKCIKHMESTVYNYCRKKCTDPIAGNEHFYGASFTIVCHEFRCLASTVVSGSPLVPQSTKCPASDGTCKDVGSLPFKCIDEKDSVVSNCQCVSKAGKASLAIEN